MAEEKRLDEKVLSSAGPADSCTSGRDGRGHKVANSVIYGTEGGIRRDPVLDALRSSVRASRQQHYERCVAARSSRVRILVENFGDPHVCKHLVQICDAMGVYHMHVVQSHDRMRFAYDSATSTALRNVNSAEKFISFHFHETAVHALNDLLDERSQTTLIRIECASEPRSEDAKGFETLDWHGLLHLSSSSFPGQICFMLGDPRVGGLSLRLRNAAHMSCYVPSFAATPEFEERFDALESLAIILAYLREHQIMVGDLCEREPDQAASLYESCLLRSSKSASKVIAKLRSHQGSTAGEAAGRFSYYC